MVPDSPVPASARPELPVLDLVHPMPGFPEQRRFALVRLDDDGVLCALRSLDDPALRFLVVHPSTFFPDYVLDVDDETVSDLQIESPEDVMVMVVLTAGDSLVETTANLRAPILVNTRSRRASQVLLDDPSLAVAAPLIA